MTNVPPWSGWPVTKARRLVATWLPHACHLCGKTVTAADRWTIEHVIPRAIEPHRTWDVSNWSVSHAKCSAATGRGVRKQLDDRAALDTDREGESS